MNIENPLKEELENLKKQKIIIEEQIKQIDIRLKEDIIRRAKEDDVEDWSEDKKDDFKNFIFQLTEDTSNVYRIAKLSETTIENMISNLEKEYREIEDAIREKTSQWESSVSCIDLE